MQKQVADKVFGINGWFVILFIMLVGAFAMAYMDLRNDFRLLQEQAGLHSPLDPNSL